MNKNVLCIKWLWHLIGGRWRVVCRGGSVCNPRKENAAACYERVHGCRRRASSQRHQSSASVLLLFTRRRRLRSSRDESFVGRTLVPVLWYPGLLLYHLIPLSLAPTALWYHPLVFQFFRFFLLFGLPDVMERQPPIRE
jgi:hypothetical protein